MNKLELYVTTAEKIIGIDLFAQFYLQLVNRSDMLDDEVSKHEYDSF